ncbi:iron-containing alcohol dehydrogenase [Albimonas sp. CAU 1670]|uniref:iron-containing alcohol dehydrogenase n=1 Tax=Albimonas sp. CAU 1670 TaxID=3032599 RepID=UPI0023DB20B5|nr:iron-containing alcohol dehydrogenase [Albimonas sp. CAU 1670]MDF2235509.1 iron-containing alcohol dehydrogenase [Albimonas sp. CAU 1670]
MPPFGFAGPAEIVFGRGRAAAEAAPRIAAFGRRVLLVRGRSPERAAWLRAALEAQGCTVEEIASAGEPTLQAATEAAEAARGAEVVVALGGGAAIDLGKAAAALATADGPPLRYLEVVGEGRPLPAAPLPFVALPTTAGAGAEATRNAVIDVPEHRRKVSLRDARMLPRLALVDPALADGCPWETTLASGLDAITQVVEPWICSRATPFTDALCAPAIPRGLAALIRLSQGEDPGARDEMAWVALCGGLALANAGLGVVHGLAGVLGGLTGAPHGAICGRLLPFGLALNAERATGEPARRIAAVRACVAQALDVAPEAAFDALAEWSRAQGLPGLAAMGLSPDEHRAAAEAAFASSSMKANPATLETADLERLLAAAA